MGKKRALIIEDNPEIAEIYRMTLSMVNFDADLVGDGKLALERLEEDVPDLIILDMNLPQVSGHYIYKQIRSEARLQHVPVIISTANSIVANAMADDLGPRDHLIVKPVSARQLQEIIQQL